MSETRAGYNYKRDSKRNIANDGYAPEKMDACQTPDYALDPLLPHLDSGWTIWEPAAGEGYLCRALERAGYRVIGSDLVTGQNFLEWEPPQAYDCIVTNPPFSIKFKWLKRCYELGRPFALLLPIETLGTATAQALFRRYGMKLMLLGSRVDFKMPKKGWAGAAQFPTAWFTWRLNLRSEIVYGKMIKRPQGQTIMPFALPN